MHKSEECLDLDLACTGSWLPCQPDKTSLRSTHVSQGAADALGGWDAAKFAGLVLGEVAGKWPWDPHTATVSGVHTGDDALLALGWRVQYLVAGNWVMADWPKPDCSLGPDFPKQHNVSHQLFWKHRYVKLKI